MTSRNRFSFVLISALLMSVQSSASLFSTSLTDPMLAHEFKKTGPWFEGWYTRVVDRESGLSVAVITTSAISANEKLPTEGPPGYIAIVVQTPAHQRTLSFEAFPKLTSIANRGDDFDWRSEGYGNSSKAKTKIEIPGSARVEIEVLAREPWSVVPGAGPEGKLALLPYMPLHWYVHNTGALAKYTVEFEKDGKSYRFSGEGEIHQEKNWGDTFPKSWMWLQAVSDEAYLALAGGDLQMGPLKAHSYMIGYRSTSHQVDFNIGQGPFTRFRDQISACDRKFVLEAVNGKYKLVVETEAAPETFAYLSIPTTEGYTKNGAIESFSAIVKTRLYHSRGLPIAPRYELLEEKSFSQAALEFGADAMKCN